MPNYAYKARTSSGKISKGEISAASKSAAKNLLANRGMHTLKITTLAAKSTSLATRKGINRYIYRDRSGNIQINLTNNLPTQKDIALFTKQFSMMIENGIPILQSLEILKEQQNKESFVEILENVSKSMEEGAALSDALEPYPKVFDSLYIALTRAGEASGNLDVIFRKLVSYIEKTVKLKAQVKSALTYPILIVLVSIAVVSGLLVFVVPTFAEQFSQAGKDLPYLTQLVVNLSQFFSNYFVHMAALTIAAVIGIRAYYNSEKGRIFFDRLILKMPLIGEVMTKISIGRFCSTMSVMINSGVSILEALEICAASAGNKTIEKFIAIVSNDIAQGENFSEPVRQSPLFPRMVSSMIEVGESTGTLDQALEKITSIYEEEVDNSIANMLTLIEPILIVVVGGIVGFIMIAMYLPIFDVAGTV